MALLHQCIHFSYLYCINRLNYVILREWNLTDNEKWILKEDLVFIKTNIAAFDTTTASSRGVLNWVTLTIILNQINLMVYQQCWTCNQWLHHRKYMGVVVASLSNAICLVCICIAAIQCCSSINGEKTQDKRMFKRDPHILDFNLLVWEGTGSRCLSPSLTMPYHAIVVNPSLCAIFHIQITHNAKILPLNSIK